MAVISSQDISWRAPLKRKGKPVGLKNLGNTCYLNSILQCLTYTPPLANFCILGLHKRQCGGDNLQCPFCLLESRVACSLENDIPLDSPLKIYRCLQKFASHFQQGHQEDAHELLRFAIDACDNVCVKLSRNGSKRVINNDIPTVMKDIFGGYLDSQIQCMSCSNVSNRHEPYMDLSLEVGQMNTLKEAIASFFQSEMLEGSNRYSCEKCKTLTVAKKQMFIHQAPNVLVIHFKRFDGTLFGKIDSHIRFEEKLSLQCYMSKASQDSYAHYSLYAAVVHLGSSQFSGHYYAYVKDPRGQWYCCNDSSVTEVDINEVLSEKVYILFYVRHYPRPALAREDIPSASSTPSPPPTPDPETSGTPASMPARQRTGISSVAAEQRCVAEKVPFSNGTTLNRGQQVKFSISKPGTGKLKRPNLLADGVCQPTGDTERQAGKAADQPTQSKAMKGKSPTAQKRTRESIESQMEEFSHSTECKQLTARLTEECREALQRSGWCDTVRKDFRDVKKRRNLSADDPDSKEQLINEARNKLLSELPSFVKENLVEQLHPIVTKTL